jgi:hypothetical protein
VLRKLIPKLQAFSQCIQETSMVRFYSSIYADDKMLIRLVWQHPADRHPLVISKLTAHDSKLQFAGLNYGPPTSLNIACIRYRVRVFGRCNPSDRDLARKGFGPKHSSGLSARIKIDPDYLCARTG